MASADRAREALLDLDGQTVVLDVEGHVARFSVKQMRRSEFRPHALAYSLTLHDRTGRRLLGFDNAHAVDRPGGRFVQQPRVYDHVHRGAADVGRPYVFVDAGTLLEDFWTAVDQLLKMREE
jgi:hypothetical protein